MRHEGNMDHVVMNGEYAGHLPSPPSTKIPPPLGIYNEPVAWSVEALPDYLRGYGWTLQQDLDTRQNAMLGWTYEDRRQAQFITPFLALGPIRAAQDASYLREAGITMLLAIRQQRPVEARIMSAAANVVQGLGLDVQQIDVTNLQTLRSVLSKAVSLIADHLATAPARFKKLGRVLVACETGNERSAAVVSAFLAEIVGLDLVSAVQVVQSHRFSANIDEELKTILRSFCDILEAQRMVNSAAPMSENARKASSSSKSSKRGREVEGGEGDVVDMMLDDDQQRFEGRTFAPFMDK